VNDPSVPSVPADRGARPAVRILVTGGAGFIGSHYVRTLLSGGFPGYAGVEVTVLDALTYAGTPGGLAPVADDPRLRFVQGDVREAADLDAALPGCDAVVNFAAETHVDRSLRAATDFVATNVLGAQQVFEAALRHGVRRVVQVSTDEVYGSIDEGSWTEGSPLEPNSPYAASKAAADLLARAYARTHGLDVSMTRGSNTYGPYQFPEKIVPLFVTRLLDGEPVPVYGDGRHARDWLHVDDHCRGIHTVLEKGQPGEAYNLAGGCELSNLELTAELIGATRGDAALVRHVPDPRGGAHDRRYSVDDARARALGWQPQVPFADGLAATVAWYRENREWWEPLRARVQSPPL
jgi:dTDP-glucose 4,6-dehydratase